MSIGGVEPHPSLDDAVVHAFAEGESVADIAHRHNLSTDAVYDIVRRTVGPHPAGAAGPYPAAPFAAPPVTAFAPPAPYPPMGPAPYRPGVGASPGDPVHWLIPTGRSWQAILAGYLGLVSLVVWVLGPVAAGFGVWALVRSSEDPRLHGRGRAIFGIVAGTAGTAALLLVIGVARR
jgi:hypothetical protein